MMRGFYQFGRFVFQNANKRGFAFINGLQLKSIRPFSNLNFGLKKKGTKSNLVSAVALFSLPLASIGILNYQTWVNDDKIAKASEKKIALPEDEELVTMVKNANVKSQETGKAPIYRIVLTGGPCGGKSTALSLISDRLRSLGFRVFTVPEAATIVITGGGIFKDMRDMTPDQRLAFEGSLMKTKMALEDAFFAIASASGEPAVIICDRGTMDTAAYLPQKLGSFVG